jgi:hypothetical protein
MTTEPAVRISGPSELLGAVPYLLGFHPSESLVLIGLDDGHLVVTARVDLAEVAEPDLLRGVVAALSRGGATALVGVVYDSGPPQPAPWLGLVDELAECVRAHECELNDLLRVSGGRWWSYLCRTESCCPPEGSALPDAASRVAAEATYAGMVALPDRAALAATLEPHDAGSRAELEPLVAAADNEAMQAVLDGRREKAARALKRAIFAAARSFASTVPDQAPTAAVHRGLPDTEVARFGVALSETVVRDPIWLAVDHGRLDGRALWRELARRLPPPYDAAPLFLFGWASWRAGNGALAAIAVERSLASDPGYSAADLLQAALAHGLSPDRVPRLRATRPGKAA